MKAIVCAGVLLVLVAVILLLASPVVREEAHWRWAAATDTAESYGGYLRAWPESERGEQARGLYDERSWRDATAANTSAALERYLRDVPEGRHRAAALDMLDDLVWVAASAASSVVGFEEYLSAFPDGKYVTQAHESSEDLRWADATATNTVTAFEAFLDTYPHGRYEAQALDAIEDLYWASARDVNTIPSLEMYLERYTEGRHRDPAHATIESLRWTDTTAVHTIAAYHRYLGLYPAGQFAGEARAAAAALALDDVPFVAAASGRTRAAYEAFLADFPGHRREPTVRSRLADMDGRSLVELIAEHKAEAISTGAGITNVAVRLRSRVDYPLAVRIPAGTYFVSGRGSAQNMVAIREQSVILSNDQWIGINVAVACANLSRDIPGPNDSFTISHAGPHRELTLLMPALQQARVNPDVAQAAVWIVTDNANYDALGRLTRGSGLQQGAGVRVIQELQVARALQILGEAGINIRTKAVWRDRNRILQGLRDTGLAEWLRHQAG